MSKSIGNVIDPFEIVDLYGADTLRFYLFREVSFGSDGAVSPEGFETRYNSELANEYGNLASRTLSMIGRYRDGVVPPARAGRRAGGGVRRPRPSASARSSTRWTSRARSTRSGAVRRLNRFVQDEEPWKLAKDEARGRAARPGALLARRGPALVSVLLHPFMPESAGAAARRARAGGAVAGRRARFGARPAAAPTVGELSPLFPRIEPAQRRGRLVVDTHCHLDACDPPGRRAGGERAGGGRRPDRHGRDERRVDRARARRR